MFQPDFEKIRQNAISGMLDSMAFRNPNDRKMAETLVQSASIVASNMLAEYHEQLMNYLQDCQAISSGAHIRR